MPQYRHMLRQQTGRAQALGQKMAGAKPGGARMARLETRQQKLSGRMDRTYGRMQKKRERMGMERAPQIGTQKMQRRMAR